MRAIPIAAPRRWRQSYAHHGVPRTLVSRAYAQGAGDIMRSMTQSDESPVPLGQWIIITPTSDDKVILNPDGTLTGATWRPSPAEVSGDAPRGTRRRLRRWRA